MMILTGNSLQRLFRSLTLFSFINGLIDSMDNENQKYSRTGTIDPMKGRNRDSRGKNELTVPRTRADDSEVFTDGTLDEWFERGSTERKTDEANDSAPKMEDFNSFEDYIEALVSHEKESTRTQSKSANINQKKIPDSDAEWDNFVGETPELREDNKKERSRADGSSKIESKSSNTKFSDSVPADDDLEIFLNSLDNADFGLSLDSILNEQGSLQEKNPTSKVTIDVDAVFSERVVGKDTVVRKKEAKSGQINSLKNSKTTEWSRGNLELLNVPTLKGMLKERGLQVSGKKADLIDRYLTSL